MNLWRPAIPLILTAVLALCPQLVRASDITLQTDHPHYPGEGAFQTVEDCVNFATAGQTSNHDRAIAMYMWFLTHQWHLMSPMQWCVPGRTPDTADPGDYETVLFDANQARFSFGYGLCGTTHAWNEPYWKALGMPARRREFPNHINSEVFYDNAWHAFDTDMAGLLFRPDGVVAGYDDIQANPRLAESVQAPLPHYPFAWPSDFNTMKAGWQEVAKKKSWYKLYNGGYAAQPGIVNLRSGESFTRYFDRDHFGGPSKRRFWQNHAGGPERKWTFFNNGEPVHDQANSNARSLATYCNAEFVYEPRFTTFTVRKSLADISGKIAFRDQSPRVSSTNGQPASITVRHFSPYVICGDPVDDKNPMSGKATNGLVVEGSFVGDVRCEVSADEGQTWHEMEFRTSDANSTTDMQRCDATEFVKGRFGWLTRFSFSNSAGIDALKFTTTTQVSQAIYPRLTENGCDVKYRSGRRGVVAMIPNFGLPESKVSAFEEVSMRSTNLQYEARSPKQRLAYHATDQKPASVVFKLSSPQKMTEVIAAVRYQIPVPPTPDCDFRLEVSTDHGRSWTEFAKADIPDDNEFSSGWLSGKADVSAAASKNALIRFHMHTPGRKAGLIDARFYGIHDVEPLGPVAIEFGWLENGVLRTHQTQLGAKTVAAELKIPTQNDVVDRFIRVTATD